MNVKLYKSLKVVTPFNCTIKRFENIFHIKNVFFGIIQAAEKKGYNIELKKCILSGIL